MSLVAAEETGLISFIDPFPDVFRMALCDRGGTWALRDDLIYSSMLDRSESCQLMGTEG